MKSSQFTHSEFDSSLFGRDVFKAEITTHGAWSKLARFLKDNSSRGEVYFVFAPVEVPTTTALERQGFHCISIRAQYVRSALLPSPKLNRTFADAEVVTITSKDRHYLHDLHVLAEYIGTTSRYHKDPLISHAKAMRLYRTWMENSLFHGYADQIFGLKVGDSIVGCISLKKSDKTCQIDLIGVLPAFQGKGLGALLMHRAIQWAHTQKCNELLVITEGENVGAIQFYNTYGFTLARVQLVYHKHC